MSASTPIATPASSDPVPDGIGAVALPPGLKPEKLADLLFTLPAAIGAVSQADVTSTNDSATVVYIDDPKAAQPHFGIVVAVIVEPSAAADAVVSNLERTRWGDPKDHTITASGAGGSGQPAFREFWRIFPPSLFALPNVPIYFLLWYRANDGYAFMLLADSPALRSALAQAMAATFGHAPGTATPAR